MKYTHARLFFLVGCVIFSSIPGHVQESASTATLNVRKAHDFLRSLYPDLNGKGYVLSLESSQPYDAHDDHMSNFKLFIGERRKGFIKGSIGGYTGANPPQNYLPGPIYATQYLMADFSFDDHGRLLAFSASGPAVGDPDRLEEVGKIGLNHQTMTANQAAGTLIQAGAKFGSWNHDKFLESVRAKNLDQLLGKISVTSAEFPIPGKDNALPTEWPMWTVTAKASAADGSEIIYEMQFEPFKGDLISLTTVPSSKN